MAFLISPVGPPSCSGCQTSCFASQLGKPISMKPEIAQLFEQMRGFLVSADVAYRSRQVGTAKSWREKAVSTASRIFEKIEPYEVSRYAEYMDKMVRQHAGSPESFNFLEGE